jgi:hypothetical protein
MHVSLVSTLKCTSLVHSACSQPVWQLNCNKVHDSTCSTCYKIVPVSWHQIMFALLVPSVLTSCYNPITNKLAGRWVRDRTSHPRCIQSRTHRTCKYVWFLSHTPSHTPSHTHICSSSRYIRRCFVNIFPAKKITGLLILLYVRLDYLYCIIFFGL